MLGGQQLPAEEGLPNGNAHALFFAPLEQVEPFFHGADAPLVALLKVVSRVDGEHHHVHKPRVQNAVGHRRGVGGEADVPDGPLGFQRFQVVQHADLHQLVKIRILIHAMQEAKVDIIRPQRFQFPQEGLLDGVKIPAPAVFAVFIIHGAKVDLDEYPVPLPGDGPAEGGIGGPGSARSK